MQELLSRFNVPGIDCTFRQHSYLPCLGLRSIPTLKCSRMRHIYGKRFTTANFHNLVKIGLKRAEVLQSKVHLALLNPHLLKEGHAYE